MAFQVDRSFCVSFLWSTCNIIRNTQTTGPQTDNEMPMLNTLPPFLHPESLYQPFPSPPRATSRSFPTFAKISWAHRDVCLLVCFSCVFLISGRPCRSQKKGHMKRQDWNYLHFIKKMTMRNKVEVNWGLLACFTGLFIVVIPLPRLRRVRHLESEPSRMFSKEMLKSICTAKYVIFFCFQKYHVSNTKNNVYQPIMYTHITFVYT